MKPRSPAEHDEPRRSRPMNDPVHEHLTRAHAALAANRPAEAEHAARAALAMEHDNAPALLALGWARLAQHHAQDALRLSGELTTRTPRDAHGWLLRAAASVRTLGGDTFREAIGRCLELAPQWGAAWTLLTEWHLFVGTIDAALPIARRAVLLEPASARALVAATRVLSAAVPQVPDALRPALIDEASRCCTALDAQDPLSVSAIRAAVALAIARGEANAVVLRCKKALSHEQRSCALWSSLALALFHSGRESEALEAITQALVIDPLDPEALDVRAALSLAHERDRMRADEALDARTSIATSRANCAHETREVLNPYEFVRKFRCLQCEGVMMCACDQAFGERFLPHQLQWYNDAHTRERKPVTLGFVRDACPTCRGEREIAAPRKEGAVLQRYYWRELTRRAAMLRGALSFTPGGDSFDRQALDEITELHRRAPVYDIPESESERAFLERLAVTVRAIEGTATTMPTAIECARTAIVDAGVRFIPCSSDAFASMFGALLGPVIQSASDPNTMPASFGVRDAASTEARADVTTLLPRDFGTAPYAQRQREALDHHFRELPTSPSLLVQRYDRWVVDHRGLVTYLWADRQEDVVRALLLALPAAITHQALRYLVEHYNERRRGWPTGIVVEASSARFVTVVHSKSRLSDDQRRWIEDNHRGDRWPFELLRVAPSKSPRRTSRKP